MTKEKKILLTFSVYLFFGFLICFIGLSNVFAATYYVDYSYSQKYFDNNGSTVTGVTTTWNQSLESYVSDDITTSANSYGAGLSITSPIPILENHTYTLSFSFVERNNIALSSKNYIGISSTLQGAANNYANNDFENELITSSVSNNSILNFAFTSRRNGQYIFIPWTTLSNTSQSYVVTEIIMEDLGSEGISINDINSSLTNQTNEINTSIENSTNTITGAITDVEDSINGTIKDNFNSCRDSYNLLGLTDGTYNSNGITAVVKDGTITLNGTATSNSFVQIPAIFNINLNKTYTLSANNPNSIGTNDPGQDYADIRIIDSSYSTLLRTFLYPKNSTNTGTLTIHPSYFQVRTANGFTYNNFILSPMLNEGSSSKSFEPYGEEICKNKIDETNDKLDETNDKLDNIDDTLTNSDIDNNSVSSSFDEFENFIDDNATISSLLTLPVTLFSAILTGLQNSCSPFNLGSLYGEDLVLPCIDISSYLGTTLWTMIDIIISGFAIYFISQKFIKVFNTFSSMKEGDVIDD